MIRRQCLLSPEETSYLEHLASEEPQFADILNSFGGWRVDQGALSLLHTQAELLREYFTERLARVGFDAEYKPNAEGQVLEQLIDDLYSTTTD